MNRWSSRLDRLADRIGGRGCPKCGSGGTGPVRFRSTDWGDSEPEACATCGVEPYRFTLKLDSPNNAGTSNND